MSVKSFKINSFRNFQVIQINPSEKVNYIYGDNGSGKTSLLEAIYVLGTGSSFRHNDLKYLVKYGSEGFTLKLKKKVFNNEEETLELKRMLLGKTLIRTVNALSVSKVQLVKRLPIQLFNYKDYQILIGSPCKRRQLLDWGLFHVEQSFHGYWVKYQHALKQRNAALKSGYTQQQISGFDLTLIKTGIPIHNLRVSVVKKINKYLIDFAEKNFGIRGLLIQFKQGWGQEFEYGDMLKKRYKYDIMLGYTQQGPHCSDFDVLCGDKKIQYDFSLGQQKIISVLLKMAVSQYVCAETNKKIVYLIDDLLAELDEDNKKKIMEVILSLKGQVFLSSVKNEFSLGDKESRVFHVEHGAVKCVERHNK